MTRLKVMVKSLTKPKSHQKMSRPGKVPRSVKDRYRSDGVRKSVPNVSIPISFPFHLDSQFTHIIIRRFPSGSGIRIRDRDSTIDQSRSGKLVALFRDSIHCTSLRLLSATLHDVRKHSFCVLLYSQIGIHRPRMGEFLVFIMIPVSWNNGSDMYPGFGKWLL